jgi:DNA-binding MarR family transcriptional regulator
MADPRVRCTLLTTHALVLLCIAREGQTRIRDLAEQVGVTERTAQTIIADLVRDGYVARTRVGRRNVYEVNRQRQLEHPLTGDSKIGELLDALGPYV